jgi:(R,R)-butanediol dehydrogenase/meso-butanediol dehydrogenase/diacetyl reductase
VLGLHVDGGLAEYVIAARDTCVPVPSTVEPEVAVFAEPTAVAIRALRKATAGPDDAVVVVGAGTVGCLVAQLARAGGADVVVVEPDPYRRGLAEAFGAVAVAPHGAWAAVRARTAGRGADVVVECAGPAAAVRAATELVRAGGTIVLVGTGDAEMMLPVRRLLHREITVRGSVAHLWDLDVAPAVAALASGMVDVRPLLADVVPLDRAAADGFVRLEHDPRALKILVAP